jgi:tetratricopeptide (TPR) repeat protein
MKRMFAVAVLLAGAAVVAALAYQAAARDRAYRAYLGQGAAALADDQTFGAIEAYSGAIALRPDSMLAHLRRGEAYQHRTELEAATNDFRRAADLDPSATRPLEALGDVLFQRGRYQRSAEIYERRLAVDSLSARVSLKLAVARYRAGQLDQALAAAREAVRLDENMADAHYLIGMCLRDKQQPAEAAAALEKAAAILPALVPAREELAELYAAMGRRGDELEQLQLIAVLDRTRPERQVALGLAQARAGQEELAVLTLGHALDRSPDHPLIYGALGQVWLRQAVSRGDAVALGKALEALERAAATDGATSTILVAYGRALLMDNQIEAAERVLMQATRRFPVDPSALATYAPVAERLNHTAAARTALIDYGALVTDEPDFGARAASIARLSLRLDDQATAASWIARGLEKDPGNAALQALDTRVR